jgi:hypothetical protein
MMEFRVAWGQRSTKVDLSLAVLIEWVPAVAISQQ